MTKVIHQRAKCIGCNYCVELAPERWRMSRKDGKAVLIGGKDKKGFYAVDIHDIELEQNQRAADACPVKIIQLR